MQLQHIDLTTEGTRSHVNGAIDFTRWPEQVYNVNSTIDFAKMREIFFPNETWRLGGDGQFTGIFRYAKDDGLRELAGDFTSDSASVNDLEFPDLHGSLVWTNTRFAVTHAESDLLGGRTRFDVRACAARHAQSGHRDVCRRLQRRRSVRAGSPDESPRAASGRRRDRQRGAGVGEQPFLRDAARRTATP